MLSPWIVKENKNTHEEVCEKVIVFTIKKYQRNIPTFLYKNQILSNFNMSFILKIVREPLLLMKF